MGEKRKQAQTLFQKITKPRPEVREDVSSKEAWDRYYTMTSCVFYSESHADWPQLRTVITRHLSSSPPPVNILVPACGNSRLSEHMYDAGFTSITNVDFSSLVIAHMLNRNPRERPQMKWRVGDMTKLEQYANETFDAVVDKGGFDGLMNPELSSLSVTRYLYEVKRLLKVGGKYVCVTFGEMNVLAILFLKFRFGWNVCLHAIALDSSSGDIKQQAFIVVAEKLACTAVSPISLSLYDYEAQRHGNTKADEFYGALEREEMIRKVCSNDSDVFTPLENLVLVAKANLSKLDAPVDFGPFPVTIITDISHFIKQLDPTCADEGECWVFVVDDVVKNEEILHQAVSALSGLIVIDDVIYKETGRRFPDIESFSIAEALYTIEVSIGVSSDVEEGKASTSETKTVKQRNPHFSSSEPHGEELVDGPFNEHGSTSLILRVTSDELIVGVDSLATFRYRVEGIKREFQGASEEKFVTLSDGIYAAVTGDIRKWASVVNRLQSEIARDIKTLSLADIATYANIYLQSMRMELGDHRTTMFIIGWIKEYKRYDILEVGDYTTHPIERRDEVLGGGGYVVGLNYLQNAEVKNEDALIEGMMRSASTDPFTGGPIKVYHLYGGLSPKCVYDHTIFDTISNPEVKSYEQELFRGNSVIFVMSRDFRDYYGPEDLYRYLRWYNNIYSRNDIHRLDSLEEDDFCAFIVYLPSKEVYDRWFDKCHQLEGLPLAISHLSNIDGAIIPSEITREAARNFRIIPYAITRATARNFLLIRNLKSVKDVIDGRWDVETMI